MTGPAIYHQRMRMQDTFRDSDPESMTGLVYLTLTSA